MKTFFTTLFLLQISTITFAQAFKKDWSAFTPSKNWEVQFINAHSSFLGKKEQGQLILKSKADSLLKVTYSIFLKSDVDSVFQKQVMDWMFLQSCSMFSFSKGIVNFDSFAFHNYYYLLAPCHKCTTWANEECNKLARQLQVYVLKK